VCQAPFGLTHVCVDVSEEVIVCCVKCVEGDWLKSCCVRQAPFGLMQVCVWIDISVCCVRRCLSEIILCVSGSFWTHARMCGCV